MSEVEEEIGNEILDSMAWQIDNTVIRSSEKNDYKESLKEFTQKLEELNSVYLSNSKFYKTNKAMGYLDIGAIKFNNKVLNLNTKRFFKYKIEDGVYSVNSTFFNQYFYHSSIGKLEDQIRSYLKSLVELLYSEEKLSPELKEMKRKLSPMLMAC